MNRGRSHRHAQGFSLVVVLVLLVVLSILGIAVMRSSTMQERMSGNLRDLPSHRERRDPTGKAALFSSAPSVPQHVHDAEHAVMECLGETLWHAQRAGGTLGHE